MLICVAHCLGLIVIPKAASNTVMNAVRASGKNWGEKTAGDFVKLSERVAFIREPHARAESAYRMYRRTGCGQGHDLGSFERFVESICREHNDPHAMPQVRLCGKGGRFIANRVIRWDFAALAGLLGVERVPHDNPSDPSVETEWTTHTRAMFDKAFAADLELWHGRAFRDAADQRQSA